MSGNIVSDESELAALMCSRICHDLISPVGAVGNGVELLDAVGGVDPEVRSLLADSARTALAALGFFRVAFGAATADAADIPVRELGVIAAAYFAEGRHRLAWPRETGAALPRAEAKLALLMTMAGASAAPIGGTIELRIAPALEVVVTGQRAGLSESGAALLADPSGTTPATPREAHLAYLARHAARLKKRIATQSGGGGVTLRAEPA